MTNKVYTIAIESKNEPSSAVSINASRTATQGPVKIPAKGGATYQISDAGTGFAPQQIQAKRKGKDLLISLEQNDPDKPDVIIENYFGVKDSVVTGLAENGQHYPYIPDTALQTHAINNLSEGVGITQVLGGQVIPQPAHAPVTAAAFVPFNPLLIGGAVIGLAAGAGGGGGGSTPATPFVRIASFDDNGLINNTEKSSVTVSGTSGNAAGGSVELVISDSKGNELARKIMNVADDGTWSTKVDLSNAADGTLTAKAVVTSRANVNSPAANKQAVLDSSIDADPVNVSAPGGPVGSDDWTARLDPVSDTLPKGDGSTANNRPGFVGTGEPGGTVEISMPDGSKANATVRADGTWTASYPVGAPVLANGLQSLPIKVTDLAGNSRSASLSVNILGPTVDIQVFDGTTTTPPGFINAAEQGTVTLLGTSTMANAGDRVTISIQGASGQAQTYIANVDALGNWSTTVNVTTLPEGKLTASATVATIIDGVAVTSRADTQEASKDTFIDPKPVGQSNPNNPADPTGTNDWTAKLDLNSDTGTKGDSNTAHNRPSISGTGEPGGSVEITLPDGKKMTAAVRPDGVWIATYPGDAKALDNGSQKLTVKVTDPAGNTRSDDLLLNISGPTVDITLFDGATVNPSGFINAAEQVSVALGGSTTSAKAGDIVTISIAGATGTPQTVTAAVNAAGNWSTSADVSALADGLLNATATVKTNIEGVDVTSSEDKQQAFKDVFIDSKPVSLSDPQNPLDPKGSNDWSATLAPESDTGTKGDSTTGNNRPNFTGTGEPGGRIEITLPDGTKAIATVTPDGTWSASFPTNALALPSGTRDHPVSVTDAAGNTQSGLLRLNIQSPTVDITKFDNNALINNNETSGVVIEGTAANAADVTLLFTDKNDKTLTVRDILVDGITGQWSARVNLTSLADGPINLKAVSNKEGIASAPDSASALKDIVPYTVTITNNFDHLNIANNDAKLNISESKNGVQYTLNFEASEDLLVSDLLVSGGSIKSGSLEHDGTKKVWSVTVNAATSNDGAMNLSLSQGKLNALTDSVGNPATVIQSPVVRYDTVAPAATFSNKGLQVPNTPENSIYMGLFEDFSLGVSLPSDAPISLAKVTFSNDEFSLIGLDTQANVGELYLDQSYLEWLKTGIYTVTVEVKDEAGNTGYAQQLVIKNDTLGSLTSSNYVDQNDITWNASGDNRANFFINHRDDLAQSKSDTFNLAPKFPGDASDKVFFTQTGLGSAGNADMALIENFDTRLDQIHINDLFDVENGKSILDYLRFETINLDNSIDGSKESTKIYISSDGAFDSEASSWQGNADQLIFVKDVTFNLGAELPNWLIA